MKNINLLPWREERRRVRDRQILVSAVLVVVLCVTGVSSAYSYYQILQHNQENRNQYLMTEMEKLDEQIKTIRGLEEKKASFIARMKIIQGLQKIRNDTVRMFENMVLALPEGVYFDSMVKKDKQLEFKGVAESNSKVSDLMDRLDDSDWFGTPDLNVLNVIAGQGTLLSQFDIRVAQQDWESGQGEVQ